MSDFVTFLHQGIERGGFETEDVLATVLPLMREVVALHERGEVAPLSERDIILMSVCYGRDPNGRILMNFGPINQRGGEKRLNVIFSRARQHMVLLSSLRHSDITNDYNDVANALKNFLHYAESLSRGDVALARQVLDGLNPLKRQVLSLEQSSASLAKQIATAMQARGWDADTHIGQSRFRCDVAVRSQGAPQHQVGILLDVTGQTGVLERFHTQPSILKAFGWQVLVILAKDWWHDPSAVIERIERLLKNAVEEEVTELTELTPLIESTESTAPASHTTLRRFEFTEGGSKKFWEIGQTGCDMSIRYGRIGTNGQTRTKTFPDEARTAREVQKLIAEKMKKGYLEST